MQEVGSFRYHGLGMLVAVHMVHIPGTNKFLFMERPSGYHPDDARSISGYYDFDNPTKWVHVTSPDGLFCCGHTFLDNGNLLIVGGHQVCEQNMQHAGKQHHKLNYTK